eukprot:gnl/MRDRNA2_/MRDRNA2_88163_c0_seq1.p1 gnl/MRDRNA2_/MRDRNA2_88163_c0~~gnl/MRDRNA2_/MRDRNA2_88163_c0_seq1.p1  ORF type:complete len:261 (-),score=70.43 gnl/MRDRNA2_/MRDRNA2_88163_c0_seq1:41-823(-)
MKLSLGVQVLAASLLAVSGGRTSTGHAKGLRSKMQTQSLVQALAFKYTLRLCNAYPSDKKLDVTKGKESLAAGLPYKECIETPGDLKEGDKVEFKFDGAEAGTFSIGELPQNDATLLLMITRHDTQSSAVSFESHVFASLANSQVAVLDMYRGAVKSTVKIQDKKEAKYSRSEDLRYDSVVAVNPGQYECVLVGTDGKEQSRAALVAKAKSSYVVFRSGVDGDKYKPELVVYPKDEAPKSGARSTSLLAVFAALVYAVFQ